MGTFHDDRHELHGITVVVDTQGPEIWIGRCDDVTETEVILLDADVHRGEDGGGKEEFVRRAAGVGVWKRYERVAVPRAGVASIRRLGDIEP